MVTVQEWVGREVHNGIVFTLGPGHLLQRMLRGRRRWRGAGSLLAASPSLAPPPNWMNSAAGHPGPLRWTRRLTCWAQTDKAQAQITQRISVTCCCLFNTSMSPVAVCWRQCSSFGLFLRVLLAHPPLFDRPAVRLPARLLCQTFIRTRWQKTDKTQRRSPTFSQSSIRSTAQISSIWSSLQLLSLAWRLKTEGTTKLQVVGSF